MSLTKKNLRVIASRSMPAFMNEGNCKALIGTMWTSSSIMEIIKCPNVLKLKYRELKITIKKCYQMIVYSEMLYSGAVIWYCYIY